MIQYDSIPQILYFRNWKRLPLNSFIKSEMKRTLPFYLGIIKVGAAHMKIFLPFNTPIFIDLLTSVFRVYMCILGIG